MESSAKQRLTGAVILVALVVLLVPSLLTGPSDSNAPGEDAQNDGMRQYTIDMNEQDRRAQPNEVTAEPEPASASKSGPSTRALPGEAAAPAPQVVSPPANPMSANAPVQTAPAPEPAPVSPPAAAPRTVTPPVATPPAAANQRGNFVVQLGTFASRENADKLVRDMTAKGFAAFVVPTTSSRGELYRVRVGPTRDRAAAEALAAQLKRVGQSGSIVPIS
jgi:DedD protein